MDIQKIGNYIKCKRKAQGLTQAELAGLLGITNKAVSKWENGKCLPDLSLHEKLCDALHITLNELVAGQDIESTQLPEASEQNMKTMLVFQLWLAGCLALQKSKWEQESIS